MSGEIHKDFLASEETLDEFLHAFFVFDSGHLHFVHAFGLGSVQLATQNQFRVFKNGFDFKLMSFPKVGEPVLFSNT